MSPLPHSSPSSDQPVVVEQRLFLRKKLAKPLPIELLPGKEVWLDDIGEGGLGVSGSSRLELGTATFLSFEFPDANSTIEASGEVAWCDASGRVGVRFTRVKQDSTAALKRWLRVELGSTTTSSESAALAPGFIPRPPRMQSEFEELKAEVAASHLKGKSAFEVIAERMVRLTRAAGAAIALREGNSVICKASVGHAPQVGAEVDLSSGLTAECYRTGTIINVSDVGGDDRVNPELSQKLDFRSLLIVPVSSFGEVIGIAEVLSPSAGNFEGGDVLLIASMAELIAEIYDHGPCVVLAPANP